MFTNTHSQATRHHNNYVYKRTLEGITMYTYTHSLATRYHNNYVYKHKLAGNTLPQ